METISRQESQYARSLIEANLDPLVTISTEGKITDMNEALANITGMTREKLTGTDFFDYFTEPQRAREVYQEVFAKGSVADSPLTLRHKDGKLTDVLFNGSVYKDDRGNVLGAVIVARDVTDQKRIATELIEAKVFADLAKVDAGKMTFEQTPFKMALSISAMLHLFETKIREKKLEMVKECDNKIPIIALIADVTTVDLAKCKAVGMNDYIAKPIDERLLYNKIVGLVKKSSFIKYNGNEGNGNGENKKIKCIDLEYLISRTKSDPTN